MNKENLLKQTSEELGATSVYEEYKTHIDELTSKKIRIGILGQPNTAKTTFVNALLGTQLPTSNIPSGISYAISHGIENTIQESQSTGFTVVKSNSKWFEKHDVNILEINKDIILDEINQVELCKLFSRCDVCVYLLNAQAALNRTDMFILKNLSDVGISTLLVFSRVDLLSKEDFNEVLEFVNNNLQNCKTIEVLDCKSSLLSTSITSVIENAVDTLLAKVDVAKIRENFENFYLGYALSQLFVKCQEKIDTCKEKQENIEKLAEDKKNKLNEKLTDWLRIETQLRQETSNISERLRNLLENRKSDMLRRLSHDVDVCGDIKLFWEKDFPFRLEEMMKGEIQSVIQMVNQELIKIMQWLQDELLKQFRCKMSLTTGVVGDNQRNSTSLNSIIEIADTNKLKIVARIGTAATVIAAGALFATSGIGGIIMAVSMVSGLGAEFFMRKQTNDSKEQIKRHLPEIVGRAQLQIVTDFNQKIQDVTDELVSHLQTLKTEWEESSIKSIEQEKAIATFNFNPSKWDNVMSRINQLSEIILK